MTDALDRMRAESDWLKAELTLRAEIERLRKERDEARREIIFLTCDICEEDECRFEVMDRARSKRGWEYLKENKENTNG